MRGCVTWRRNMACARARFEELIELGELHLSRGALRVCDMRALSIESHLCLLPPTNKKRALKLERKLDTTLCLSAEVSLSTAR